MSDRATEASLTGHELKQAAAGEAAQRVTSGTRLGLGTGSTAALFLDALAARVQAGEVTDIVGVPTSRRTEQHARELGIPLATLDEIQQLDLGVDGADEVDPALDLIKGLGGALLREKIVAGACARFVVIVDDGKLVERLGQQAPVPVEVLPFGWRATARAIESLGGAPALRETDGTPYLTDQGNHILDSRFTIEDAPRLGRALDAVPGVLGHGLFLGMTSEVIIARAVGDTVASESRQA